MQAQAQCVKEKAVTAQESMVLAKVLVRVAIHHVRAWAGQAGCVVSSELLPVSGRTRLLHRPARLQPAGELLAWALP